MATRITSNMTTKDAIITMCDGNPGALSVLAQLAQSNPLVMLSLDMVGIYGSDIWVLYKNIGDSTIETLCDNLKKLNDKELHAKLAKYQ